MVKCGKENTKPKFALPESERIYYKDFHFLDEPLVDKKKPKESEKKPTPEEAEPIPEETKGPKEPSSNLVFSNQKDEQNQDRTLSMQRDSPAKQNTPAEQTFTFDPFKKAKNESPRPQPAPTVDPVQLFPNLAKPKEDTPVVVEQENYAAADRLSKLAAKKKMKKMVVTAQPDAPVPTEVVPV